uniref:Uncharacterized protein n=1 Tax=Romanomermis culicivorax TaxID=13658 RepID=A0A915HEZ6_ROMCU
MRLVIDSLLHVAGREQRAGLLNTTVDLILKQNLSCSSVDKDIVERALRQLSSNDDENLDLFAVINVFDAPKFEYVPEKRKFRKYDRHN